MKIITTGPVRHDGKDVEIGATLDLSEQQGRDLIETGYAELHSKKAKVEKDGGDGEGEK